MKNILTILVKCDSETSHPSSLYDGIDIIYSEKESEKDFVLRAIKNATGKYAVLLEQKFKFANINSLLNVLDKNSPDMVIFDGGTAIKTPIIKGIVKNCEDVFSCVVMSTLSCKTVLKSDYVPFSFDNCETVFTEENYDGLLAAAREFIDVKAKLSKEIYAFAMNALCSRLITF